MDSASDLAVNALQVADDGGTARVGGGGCRKLSKNRKGRRPYLQDPHAHVHAMRPSIMQKWFADIASAAGRITNGAAREVVNVDETDYPHSPVLPRTLSLRPRQDLRLWD